jgi:hypothetical protein
MLPLALLISLLMSCATTPRPAESRRVPEGQWGGGGIAIDVGKSGARIEFDCAHGTIDQPLAVDAEGQFDQPGTWGRDHPGPIRMGEEKSGEPARYRGKLEGGTLTLQIHLARDGRSVGSFTATQGATPRIHRCL